MLVLSRKQTECLIINDNIVVTVLSVRGNKVQLGVDAPREMSVFRGELDRRQAIGVQPKSPIIRRLRTIDCQASWKSGIAAEQWKGSPQSGGAESC